VIIEARRRLREGRILGRTVEDGARTPLAMLKYAAQRSARWLRRHDIYRPRRVDWLRSPSEAARCSGKPAGSSLRVSRSKGPIRVPKVRGAPRNAVAKKLGEALRRQQPRRTRTGRCRSACGKPGGRHESKWCNRRTPRSRHPGRPNTGSKLRRSAPVIQPPASPRTARTPVRVWSCP